MSLPSLPDECLSNILSSLDTGSLYKCLFVNRYYCKLSIPIIWRDPFFEFYGHPNDFHSLRRIISLINTLLSCFNEDEIFSLIPCAINLINFNQPLFEYAKFIRKINHNYYTIHIETWLYSVEKQDCRAQKLSDAIYHMIMRKGSNLQEFVIYSGYFIDKYIIDLPKFSTFTICKPGIINLSSLVIICYNTTRMENNAIEFLRMVPEFCNCIVNCEVQIKYHKSTIIYAESILNIIKSQPLKRVLLSGDYYVEIKKILYTLKEFRSETLKELLFRDIDFQRADLSFISELKFLERLEFLNCTEFTFKEKLYLKELKLCYYCIIDGEYLKLHAVSIIDSFCSEILHKLTLNIVTPEIIEAVKVTSPNISFLYIDSPLIEFFNVSLIIPLIGELSSLKILHLKLIGDFDERLLVMHLCRHLISVEYLFLDFLISLQNFEYFTNNCRVKLKRLNIIIDEDDDYVLGKLNHHLRKSYLHGVYANNFQKVHGSLKILGIKGYYDNWTDEEMEIVNLLKNQGTDIVSSNEEFSAFFGDSSN